MGSRQACAQILGITRIIVGLLFLEHGMAKLVHFPVVPMFANGPLSPMLGGGIIERWAGRWSRPACSAVSPPSSARARWRWPISWRTSRRASIPVLNGGELADLSTALSSCIWPPAGPGALGDQ